MTFATKLRGRAMTLGVLLLTAGSLLGEGIPAGGIERSLIEMEGRSHLVTLQDIRPSATPLGGHWQGVAWHPRPDGGQRLYLSHDGNKQAYWMEFEMPNCEGETACWRRTQILPTDGRLPPLRHAGGIQIAEKFLAVGIEDNQDKMRSEVQFWSLASPDQPEQLTHLTIHRSGPSKDATAGAVALVRDSNAGQEKGDGPGTWLVIVGNWDCRSLDFYRSSHADLANPACRWSAAARWSIAGADTVDWKPEQEFASYQSLQLFRENDRSLILLGFATTQGKNVVDLFRVDWHEADRPQLQKRLRRAIDLPTGHTFRYGAGATWRRDRLILLATPYHFRPHPTFIWIE